MQARLGFDLRFLYDFQLTGQIHQSRFIRRVQGVAVGGQFFQPQTQRARLFADAPLVSRQHLNLLLDLSHARALLVSLGLSAAQGFF